MGKFAAKVKGFKKLSERRQKAIVGRSISLLTSDILINTTVKTGNLRGSLMSSTLAMPQFKKGDTFVGNSSQVALTIAGMGSGDTFYFGYQAAYAARWNYGFTGADRLGRVYNQTGSGVVEKSAAKWRGFVKQAERELGGK